MVSSLLPLFVQARLYQWTVTSTVPLWDDNWLPASTTVTKALAGVEVYLLSIVKSNSNLHGSNTKLAFLMSTYSALFFFLSAALSGLILTNMFEEFPARAIQWGSGSKRSCVWAMRHYMISLIVGTISLITQVLLYGWLEESILVKGTLLIVMAFAVLFLDHLVRLLLRD